MKFFTPDLLERFASEDDRVALAAQEELEQRSQRTTRPRSASSMVKSFTLRVRMTEAEYAPLEEAAKAKSLQLSSWARSELVTLAKKLLGRK
jgi:hypothetical protein